jgi:GxxExxY protein
MWRGALHFKHTDTTELIIQAFYTVYNTLGYGFLEKLYRNALAIELRKLGLDVIQEARIAVYYDGEVVGEYFADLLAQRLHALAQAITNLRNPKNLRHLRSSASYVFPHRS